VLVFTRRLDEAIVIGEGIEVKVLRIGREGVRLGVTAPPEVPVHRREIYEQIRAANTEAAARAEALAEMAFRLAKKSPDDDDAEPA
jgi:carbon storage regulator